MNPQLLPLALLGFCLTGLPPLSLGAATPSSAPRTVPKEGLLLHLDGNDPKNTPTLWHDGSPAGADGEVGAKVKFLPGKGYAFQNDDPDGKTDTVKLTAPLQPHLTDRFAYAVRLTPALPFDERKGEYAFLGNAAFPWNTLFFDIAQDAVYWNTYNKQEKIGGNLFRAAKPHKVSPRAIAESEVMLGVTWEADSNEAATGTARIYLDGNFVGEERSAMRPQGRHADITMIGGTGKKGALDWIGTISQVVVYGNFKLPPDDLMERVFEGKE
jgi:hypothetical protein